jgi:hypothetical protein
MQDVPGTPLTTEHTSQVSVLDYCVLYFHLRIFFGPPHAIVLNDSNSKSESNFTDQTIKSLYNHASYT